MTRINKNERNMFTQADQIRSRIEEEDVDIEEKRKKRTLGKVKQRSPCKVKKGEHNPQLEDSCGDKMRSRLPLRSQLPSLHNKK